MITRLGTASRAAGRVRGGRGEIDGDSRRRSVRAPRPWVPAVAGLVTFLVGLRDVAMVVRPSWWERVRIINPVLPGRLDPDAVRGVGAAAIVAAGLLLILLSHALRRRKRRAWRAVVVILAVSAVSHLLRLRGHLGWDQFEPAMVVDVVLIGALVGFRREFFALGDPRTRWRALWTFLVLTAGAMVVGTGLIETRLSAVSGARSFGDVVEHVALGLLGINGPLEFRSDRVSDVVTFTLAGMGLVIAFTTLYLALRPAEPVAILDADDERRMRALLDRHGERDSLGYFALRRDKSVVWSPSGKACIAYRVVSGVMLASGDPLGDPEAWPGAIAAFLDRARLHAWVPAVLGCSETGGAVWTREADLTALEIGDEAIVDVADFSLEGRAMRNVRQMVNRVERGGYRCEVRRMSQVGAVEAQTFRRQTAAWRGGPTERGFSMALGRLGEAADGECVSVAAYRDGALRAFLHFAPWSADGLSLDLMRRDRSADPGLNDYLITKALLACPTLGIERVSLNFAMFRSALERGERLGASPIARAWRGVLVFASRWFQIESLYRFNAKFCPRWEPRFLVYPGGTALPRVLLATMEAEAFLIWPDPRRWARGVASLTRRSAERTQLP